MIYPIIKLMTKEFKEKFLPQLKTVKKFKYRAYLTD